MEGRAIKELFRQSFKQSLQQVCVCVIKEVSKTEIKNINALVLVLKKWIHAKL